MQQLEHRVEYERIRDQTGRRDPEKEKGPGQHQLRLSLRRTLLSLAPQQVRAVHLALTHPQQALAQAALRLATQTLGLDRGRER